MLIERIFADISIKSHIIRANPPDPRHPRSIPAISVLICRIRLIRVLFRFTNNFYMHPTEFSGLTLQWSGGIIVTQSILDIQNRIQEH